MSITDRKYSQEKAVGSNIVRIGRYADSSPIQYAHNDNHLRVMYYKQAKILSQGNRSDDGLVPLSVPQSLDQERTVLRCSTLMVSPLPDLLNLSPTGPLKVSSQLSQGSLNSRDSKITCKETFD